LDPVTNFKSNIPVIFDHWKQVPKVFVCSILPQPHAFETFYQNNTKLDTIYNPYLKQEAEHFGFSLLDVNAMFRAVPNYEDLFQSSGDVHLSNAGSTWLARTICDAVKADIVAVPEPNLAIMLALPAFFLSSYGLLRWRRKSRA
jgi:hypothetical protein